MYLVFFKLYFIPITNLTLEIKKQTHRHGLNQNKNSLMIRRGYKQTAGQDEASKHWFLEGI